MVQMKTTSMQYSLLRWLIFAACFLLPVMSIEDQDQKNYYSPDPHHGTPPSGHHGSTPPSHGSGGGSHHGTPSTPSTPSNCGNPPHSSTPSNPPSGGGGGGGGYYSPPTSPESSPPPFTISPPISTDPGTSTPPNPPSGGGGGGGYYSPPTSGESSPPPVTISPPIDPGTSTPPNPPSGGGGGGYYSPPTSGDSSPPPVTITPPISIDPGTPTLPGIPTPPFYPGPNPPFTGTCNYWNTHPGVIFGLLGWWGSLGNAFGVSSLPGFGANMSLQQALSNTRTDGYGALYREGSAAWLNSMVNNRYPFNTKQVRQNFVSALHSNTAAASQAHLFKLANEGHDLKPRP